MAERSDAGLSAARQAAYDQEDYRRSLYTNTKDDHPAIWATGQPCDCEADGTGWERSGVAMTVLAARRRRAREEGRLMVTYRATDADGQVLYEASAAALGERTMQAGSKFTLWDVVQLSDDRQHAPAYVGYLVGGQLVEPEREAG
jgi:hypothetical protein